MRTTCYGKTALMFAIETENLSKEFRTSPPLSELIARPLRERGRVPALKNVTINVRKGELFGLLGPNGAGKTTLIKLLSTLIIPSGGSATVNGHRIVEEDEKVRKSIGLVTGEERSFYWRLTGRQNLEFFSALYGIPGKDAKEKIGDIFKLIELEDKQDVYVNNYSTGMKQKLAIGRALMHDPSVLFLDEPTNSLDPVSAQHMRTFISENLVQARGTTVVLTTHRMDEVEKLCDHIAIIDSGEVKFSGTVNDLRSESDSIEKAYMRVVTQKEILS